MRVVAKEWGRKWAENPKHADRKNPVMFVWLDARDKLEYITRVYGIKDGDFPRLVVAEVCFCVYTFIYYF